ncbi:TPA: hypothetical protein DEW47_03440 [Patescibacteria group bacterium]|nr:MAG: hypothetical protein UT71_C0001G0028 [Parcubacteria group bacterium GW2011_GWF2_40_10]KKR47888.1 MAG: hypothetical protein UT83_C0002G0019 [Parcubacteria group bacterium GW2011_GWA2_40_143]KKR60336.1 MAG: hypothetical protein UT97_C0002G0036 [Parcubacteria group bacterium GW2011_GWC2_40_31]KKR75312.1 MAG: hypothetical protein UU18_C0008G0002 [Parcubacteria group bacterium GW2011_GWB2_40_8]KKR76707.1 MAG: hypothetical protein UU20_C0020G0005 [Parcubacteria group bacterium GW2011_GWE2_40_
MKEYSDQEIENIYSNLPEDLRSAIFSIETDEEIVKIGKKYNLNIDKIGNLGNETGMVMLGVTMSSEFVSNLVKLLEIDKTKAGEIASDVNERIFKKVRDSLRRVHNLRDDKDAFDDGEGIVAAVSDAKSDILKEIEKEDVPAPSLPVKNEEEKMPDIFKGVTNPFEAKLKDDVYRAPKEVAEYKKPEEVEPKTSSPLENGKGYGDADPYREPIN